MNSPTRPTHLPTSDTRVLVTGGSGYVGSHLVSLLLERGHRVRATVRSAARGGELRALVDEVGGDAAERLEVAIADLSSDDGWTAAMSEVQHVMHVASPFPAGAPDDREPRSVETTIVDTARSLIGRGLVETAGVTEGGDDD